LARIKRAEEQAQAAAASSLMKMARSSFYEGAHVGLTTPEPLSTAMFNNTVKDAREVRYVIRMIEAFPKTGLKPEFLQCRRPLTEVFVRGLYLSVESRITALARIKRAEEQAQAAAASSLMKMARSSFYEGAHETSTLHVKANLRPKICRGCREALAIHDFPRRTPTKDPSRFTKSITKLEVDGDVCEVELNTEYCFACQGYPEPQLFCPSGGCSLLGQPQSRFDISTGHTNGQFKRAICYTCIEQGTGIEYETRLVPPKYFHYFGIEANSSGSSASLEVSAIDNRLDVSSIWHDGQIVGIEEIHTVKVGTDVPTEEFIKLAMRFGLLTQTDDMMITLRELSNMVCFFIDNCTGVPPWKDAIPRIMAEHHKQGALTPNQAVFRVSPPQAIESPESSEESGAVVVSSKKNCAMM